MTVGRPGVASPITQTGESYMARKMQSPQQVAKRWADSVRNNVQRYVDGIDSVTESPTQKAAAAVDRYQAGVNKAVSEGKFQDGCNAVTLEDWKSRAKNKGKANMATGATEAEPRVAKVMASLLPYTASVSDQIAAMPKGTLEDSIARSRKAIELMSQFKKPR